jgi:hypothetical protein
MEEVVGSIPTRSTNHVAQLANLEPAGESVRLCANESPGIRQGYASSFPAATCKAR